MKRIALAACLAIAGLAGISATAGAAGPISPSGVAWTYITQPTTVQNHSTEVDGSAASYRGFLKFPTPVPTGSTVSSASITFTSIITAVAGFTFYPTSTFDPNTLTWNTMPAIGSTLLGQSGAVTANQVVTVPLTNLPTANETDLAFEYNPSGIQGRIKTPGISLTVNYTSGQHKVMVIMEENHTLAQTTQFMPYLTGLGNTYGHATNYYGITHPSLPNYLGIWGGSTFGTTTDCPVGCGPIASDTSVWDQTIAAGKTAKAYQQSMPSNCDTAVAGNYAPKHGPWPYFTNATSRANCTTNDVPLTGLQADITNGNLPVTGEITPDLQNDWHDGSYTQADAFLQSWVPALMAGPDYTNGNLTIIIVFDEGTTSPQNNNVAFVVVDPRLSGKVVTTGTSHYSLTKWLEDNAGVSYLTTNVSGATNYKSAFGL